MKAITTIDPYFAPIILPSPHNHTGHNCTGQRDPYFAPFAEFEKAQRAIKARNVREYLGQLDARMRAAVEKELRRQLQDLGI